MHPSVLLAQLFALRAQVDALIVAAQLDGGAAESAQPLDPATTCPTCGATGESQKNTSTMDGTQRRHCLNCNADRVL
jgi:hypothetical protein